MKDLKTLTCWVVSEGMAGTENQCIAVAEALGIPFEVKRIGLRQPWKSLSPYLGFEQSWSFTPALYGPWPDMVIASGRKAIAASRYIKKASDGRTFTVQIQDPRVSPAQFDLVAAPHHDPIRGNNVIVSDAAPNRVTLQKLEDAKDAFRDFEDIEGPRIAVLIGGNSKAYTLSKATVKELVQKLTPFEKHLMITPSRRTGAENEAILRETLKDAYIWDGNGDNPYFAMLAYADFILVTADSASMISDACSTGKPVYMIPMDGGHPRIDKLHQHLLEMGALKIFEGNLEPYTYEALKDADRIAQAIKERLN